LSEKKRDRREYNKQFAIKYRERRKELNRNRKKPNPEVQKRYIETHKEKIREVHQVYYYANREELLRKGRAYNMAHKEQRRAYRLAHRHHARDVRLRKVYGISAEEFDSMLDGQGGACAICKKKTWPVQGKYVDHDHRGGKPRGILCYNCNVALGHLKDDISIAKSLVNYLEEQTK
jgi:hypothetical protein